MNNLFLVLALAASAAVPEARAPAVAGRFYPAKLKELRAMVERHLAAAQGEALQAVALLVPHAGLPFSGETAARAYARLPKGAYGAVIVVGTCHYKELEGAALYPGAYGTPDGAMPYDPKLTEALLAASPLIRADAAAHKKEHSIEVQIPYLRRVLGEVPLAALVMNTQDLETARKVGAALARVARERRALIVASSDQSHYPEGKAADLVDQATLEALRTLDPAYFWLANRFLMNRGVPDLAVTYCGEGAVTAVLAAARELGATRFKPLMKINSGDVVSERTYNHVVGYASGLFLKEPGEPPARPALTAAQKSLLLEAARAAVASGAKGPVPLSREPALNLPAAVFVTVRSADGALRGCLGSSEPQDTLAEAVPRLAALAATSDARFKPLSKDEAKAAKVEISVLSPARPSSAEAIKPGDGVIVDAGGKSGLFLPDVWKTLAKKEDFLAELCAQKAGLARDCWKDPAARLRVFSADSFGD